MTNQEPGSTFRFMLSAFVFVAVVLVLLACFAMFLLDATRAYTNGESLYTKGQKEAVIALQEYAHDPDPQSLRAYRKAIALPLGDRAARLALERELPDPEAAREGFRQGGNAAADIGGMIRLFLWFGEPPLFRRPLDLWRQADSVILEMRAVAQALESAVAKNALTPARRRRLLDELSGLNDRAGRVQREFSAAVGESARSARNAFVAIFLVASLLLSLVFALLTWRLDRRRSAAERSLARSEERLRILMDSTGDGMLSVLDDGRIQLANVAASRLLGDEPDRLVGRRVQDLVLAEDRAALETVLQTTLAVEDAAGPTRTCRLHARGTGGEIQSMEALCTPERTNSARRMVLTLRDLGERERLEEKLFQVQRMEAVGELTAGIAHNFNNLLTVVIGSLDEVAEELERRPADSRMYSMVASGLQAAERGAELTTQLLAFARRQPLTPRPVAVNELIDDMRGLLDQTVPADIEIRQLRSDGELRARVDRAQLESALLNLVFNARRAMPTGGRITLETAARVLSREAAAGLDLEPGDYVSIRVTDTGEGIASEHLPHVVEPFFTTRDVGEGTGLGLSMVHGFVRQPSGQIRIESTVGEGTTIELLLPVAGEEQGQVQAERVRG